MSPDVILLCLIVAPALLFMLLRANATLIFLSVCLGAVLLQFVGGDTEGFLDLFAPSADPNTAKITLLLLPVMLTTLFMIKTVQGAKLAMNILPALGASLLLVFLVVPLLSAGLAFNLMTSQTWLQVQKLQPLIVGFSALICLLFLWMQRPRNHHGKHGKHH